MPQTDQAVPADLFADYHPVTLSPRRDGWTADRQRCVLQVLAATGCISSVCDEVDMAPRSADRLRDHPNGAAFARLGRGAADRDRAADDAGVRARDQRHPSFGVA